jgi:abequosyltransferase
MPQRIVSRFKLSICIATRNRAALIRETLINILKQATPDCEVVVVDGASTDDTEGVVRTLAERHDNVRYFKQDKNGGVDRDFDRAVELARGEYCWLMPDDDVLQPDAIQVVLDAINKDYFLVIINTSHFDAARLTLISSTMLKTLTDNRIFRPHEVDELFNECWILMSYIGSCIMQRKVWLERDRNRYYGKDFIHIGVIFQEPMPGDALVIAAPLISIRTGNQSWFARYFEVWEINWPSIVWSLALSNSAKMAAANTKAAAWSFSKLLFYRAMSCYSLESYRRHVRPGLDRRLERILPILAAVAPGKIANTYLILRALFLERRLRAFQLLTLRSSRNCLQWWRIT